MILYTFISCKPLIGKCYQRIVDMMRKLNNQHFIIVVGGFEHTEFSEKDHILKLNCNDYYEGLPEKIIKTYDFINRHERFDMYTHFCKLDDDMVINHLIPVETITDYCGDVCYVTEGPLNELGRRYHINRCSKNSKFNKTKYLGEYVPWCLGGSGYILSRKSLSILSNGKNYYNEIYEDLYVAKLLERKNIYPQIYPNLAKLVSPIIGG
jgi:hypothetical protein